MQNDSKTRFRERQTQNDSKTASSYLDLRLEPELDSIEAGEGGRERESVLGLKIRIARENTLVVIYIIYIKDKVCKELALMPCLLKQLIFSFFHCLNQGDFSVNHVLYINEKIIEKKNIIHVLNFQNKQFNWIFVKIFKQMA